METIFTELFLNQRYVNKQGFICRRFFTDRSRKYTRVSQNLLNGSVFIHCNAGVTRSASAVIFYDAIFLHRQIIVYYDNK